MENSENTRRRPHSDRDDYGEEAEVSEPDIVGTRGGLGFATLGGLLTGVLSSAISIGLTLANNSNYQQANKTPGDLGLSYILTGFWCLNVILALALSFGAGFVVGKRTLRRSYGFIAGVIAGIVIFAGNFLVVYIPGYPAKVISNVPLSVPSFGMTIVADLIAILLLGMILGLFGLWGASVATKRLREYQEEE